MRHRMAHTRVGDHAAYAFRVRQLAGVGRREAALGTAASKAALACANCARELKEVKAALFEAQIDTAAHTQPIGK